MLWMGHSATGFATHRVGLAPRLFIDMDQRMCYFYLNLNYNSLLTQRAESRLLDHRQTAVVNGQMTDVEAQEHESLQLGQRIVTQLQVENDRIATLQRAHRMVDVINVGRFAQNIEAILLNTACTR